VVSSMAYRRLFSSAAAGLATHTTPGSKAKTTLFLVGAAGAIYALSRIEAHTYDAKPSSRVPSYSLLHKRAVPKAGEEDATLRCGTLAHHATSG
jgi:hypothetical protein